MEIICENESKLSSSKIQVLQSAALYCINKIDYFLTRAQYFIINSSLCALPEPISKITTKLTTLITNVTNYIIASFDIHLTKLFHALITKSSVQDYLQGIHSTTNLRKAKDLTIATIGFASVEMIICTRFLLTVLYIVLDQ